MRRWRLGLVFLFSFREWRRRWWWYLLLLILCLLLLLLRGRCRSVGRRRIFGFSAFGLGNIGPISLGNPIGFLLGIGQLQVFSKKVEPLFFLQGSRGSLDIFKNYPSLSSQTIASERNDL